MVLKVSKRGLVPPFIVMDVLRAANELQAAGEEVLHLEVGQPATPAPQKVREAAKRALDQELIGYTDAFGLPALRLRIAEHYRRSYDLELPAERIAVTPGSSGAFLLSFLAAFDPGDRVALVNPGYPAYRNILTALGLEPVLIPSEAEHRYQPSPELLETAGPLDGLILASPSNPAGTMLDRKAMTELCSYCEDRGIRMISDEIYHGITYGAECISALELSPSAILVNSFSKYYSMTGWRLGWCVLPEDLVRPIECLAQNLFISAPALSQHAAIAAFDCYDELDGYVRRYAENRSILLEGLPKAGFDKMAPADGAFYLYADVGHMTNDSQDFCKTILAETGVAITPGVDFDPQRGHQTVRFSFAGSPEQMCEACFRLEAWAKKAG